MILYVDPSALVKRYVTEEGVAVTEALVERAETVAWEYRLRGYDAVQLAAALTWREAVGQSVLLATFDRQLWEAAPQAGFEAWPKQLPGESTRAH